MRKKEIKTYLFLIIIVGIIIATIYVIKARNSEAPSTETTKCIAQNSLIYVQFGCHACELQEEIFKDDYIYLNIIDCAKDRQKCVDAKISVTPTWIINNEKYPGVASIDVLKDLTGC